MNIFITGINGFIGSHLAVYLKSMGHTIFGSSRAAFVDKRLSESISGYWRLQLDEPIEADIFNGMEAVIHCAHALKGRNLEAVNVNGTRKIFNTAEHAEVRIQVFPTSYSAKEGTRSEYARTKFILERFFLTNQQVVIRPGLVIGPGGLFRDMVFSIRKFPVIPLIDGGRQLVPLTHVGTLCQAINRILAQPIPGIYNIFQEKMITMKELVQSIKRFLNARCLLLPVPGAVPLLLLKSLEALRIPLPIKSDSILALRENQELGYHSSLPDLGLREKDLSEIMKEMCTEGYFNK